MIPSRPAFWNVAWPELFYALAAVALMVCGLGVVIRARRWWPGLAPGPWSWVRLGRALRDGLLGWRLLRGDPPAGIMHALILWGFLGLMAATCLVAMDHYLAGFLRGPVYLYASALWEACGLALVAGLVWALARRYVQRLPRLERRPEDLLLPAWLAAVVLTGFLVEAARLAAQPQPWERWSFVGWRLASLFASETAPLAHAWLWWGHALLSLALIAYLPHGKLFHALAAPVSLYLQDQPRPLPETGGGLHPPPEFSPRQLLFLDACTRCGRCLEACPSAAAGEPFSPREFLARTGLYVGLKYSLFNRLPWLRARHRARLLSQPTIIPGQAWYCTTCAACLEACPVGVGPLEVIGQIRSALVEQGSLVPAHLALALERLQKYENPWISKKGQKAGWAQGLKVADLAQGGSARLLYFVGCTTSLDIRAQGLAQSLALVLDHCGVEVATLGKREPCCGDIARRVGENGLFEEQREGLQALLRDRGVAEVVASSPHCFHTLRNDYALAGQGQGMRPWRARHYTQLLARLADQGRLSFTHGRKLAATYHDPCYLARHNGVVAEPRRVLAAMPGLELREMADHGRQARCCGGGGGRMWQELAEQAPLAQRRLEQALATGARVLVTACPLCLIMLEDACKTAGAQERLLVRDLSEVAAWSLGLKEYPALAEKG